MNGAVPVWFGYFFIFRSQIDEVRRKRERVHGAASPLFGRLVGCFIYRSDGTVTRH